MLSIDSTRPQQKLRPHVVPCKISYNGPVDTQSRYWDPKSDEHGTQTAYLRGRKLLGKTVALPEGYEGVVLQKTDRTIVDVPTSHTTNTYEEEEDDEDMNGGDSAPRELKIVEQLGTFDSFTVWAHESTPSDTEDPYLKAASEWIRLSHAIHGEDNEEAPAVAT